MPLLKALSLKSCHSLMSLPNSFVQLKMLETLMIDECIKLSVLPEDFGRLSYLKDMALIDCHLLKELPHGFGALPALKTFSLCNCDSFVNLPRDFTELTCLEKLTLWRLPLISRIPDGCRKLTKLGSLNVYRCYQLKTLSNDFENMSTLEELQISYCPELDGAMMEKIIKLQNCYSVDITRSRKLMEKWKQMQSKIEHPIVVFSGLELEDRANKQRGIRHALLHGKCMEMNNATHQLMERSSLFAGLEEGTKTTVALIMLPVINIRSNQHRILQRFVEMARERAKTNGSGKLQIVCARKSVWTPQRATPTEEEESIPQILLSLPMGEEEEEHLLCAIPSSEYKRVKILSASLGRFQSVYKHSFFMGDAVVDREGSKIFKNMKFMNEYQMRASKISEPKNEQSQCQSNSIENFVNSICGEQSQSVAGQSKRRELIEALKGNGIHHLLIDNNTSKVMVDDLDGKSIGFIICGFRDLKCIKLQQIYKEFQQQDSNFIAIWIPTVWPKYCGHGTYARLIQCMPWATFPQLINIKTKYPRFVVLDEHGQIAKDDALPLLLAWGVKCYPFTQHTIPESFSLMESESCLEFLLHGMNIVGRKPMKSKMTFLFAGSTSGWHRMKCQLQELTQIHGNFEVLYVGKFYGSEMNDLENKKQEYEDAVQYMHWSALSFSDMMMFWLRCHYLASKEGLESNKESKRMMESVHGLAQYLTNPMIRRSLVLVENDIIVTYVGEDVVQMICDENSDGEGMVKEELMKSLRGGACTPIVKTFFRDEIDNHPHHPQHRISYSARREHQLEHGARYYTCDVCFYGKPYGYGYYEGRQYRCEECEWWMCGSCWMAWAKQQLQQLLLVGTELTL